MTNEYNIYIDETCHLEHDGIPVMCIGSIKLPKEKYSELTDAIKKIKVKHHNPTEIKWNKLSMSRLALYKELIDLLFDSPMQFRAVLVKKKERLNNALYNESDHNVFYYKAAYYLLRYDISSTATYRVYFDIKEAHATKRLKKISEILDRTCGIGKFTHFQNIKSDEIEFVQLADLLIGAIGYRNRDDIKKTSAVKNELIDYIEYKAGQSLAQETAKWKNKFNIFDLPLRSE